MKRFKDNDLILKYIYFFSKKNTVRMLILNQLTFLYGLRNTSDICYRVEINSELYLENEK